MWDSNPSLLFFQDEHETQSICILNINSNTQGDVKTHQILRKNLKLEIPVHSVLNLINEDRFLIQGDNEVRIIIKQDIWERIRFKIKSLQSYKLMSIQGDGEDVINIYDGLNFVYPDDIPKAPYDDSQMSLYIEKPLILAS